jgi:arylsulfatase A-like enzyme
MNAIVVTFDRLPVGFLACYGNGWIATPNFDRLAANSALFHQHFVDCTATESTSAAWWSGRHECRRDRKGTNRLWLPSLLADHGVSFRMLVETTGDGGTKQSGQFPAEYTETVRGTDGLDVAPEETPFFRLVARAQRDLRLLRTSRKEPWLLWLKSRGVPLPWLAPREFATIFLDVEDDQEADLEPDEPADVENDDNGMVEMSGDEFDDLLRSVAQLPVGRNKRDALSEVERGLMRRVCGGYVALLDAALGRLLDQIDQDAATAPTLLIVTAARGITVREPGLMLDDWEELAEETVHTPLFVRQAGMNRGVRCQDLVQTVDVFPTLAEWFGVDVSASALDGKSLLPAIRGEKVEPRSRALIADGQKLAGIRTSDYYLVTQQADANEGEKGNDLRRLFAKPEDIWEANDVAAQSPDMVDQLAGQLEELCTDEPPSA